VRVVFFYNSNDSEPPKIKALTMRLSEDERSVEELDRALHRLIMDLFAMISSNPSDNREKSDTERLAAETIKNITHEADNNKELMARYS